MSESFLLHDKLTEICAHYADQTAFVDMLSNQSFTFAQILKLSGNIGSWLCESGVKKQDKVALILENCPQWPMIYFGIMFSGATVVPIDPKLSELEICNIIKDSQAIIAFAPSELKSFFEKNLSGLKQIKKVVLLNQEKCGSPFVAFADTTSNVNHHRDFPRMSEEDIASIIYTSGTTDKPKGVMLTHKNFSSNYSSLENLQFCFKGDCFISILPLHHVFAFTATLLFPLFLGAKVAYPKSIKSDDLMDCLRKNGVTVFMGVPELFNMFHKSIFAKLKAIPFIFRKLLELLLNTFWILRRLSNINLARIMLGSLHKQFGGKLKYFVSGGAKLNSKVAEDLFRLGFTILEGYGLTETAPVATFNIPLKYKIGSAGRAISGVEIKTEENGEILIKGNNVMPGYYKNTEQTEKVIKDDWFYTGDSGHIDKDGFLFITGRIKEMLVLSSGKNIYPEEIETYFKESSFIKEICILTIKNPQGNDVLAAVVVPDFEYFKKVKDANINRKIKWELENLSSKLPSYKRITDFIVATDEFPKTRLGKLKRYEIRNHYEEKFSSKKDKKDAKQDISQEDIELLNTEVGKKTIEFLKENTSIEKIRLSDHLELDLGLDSLARAELAVGLEIMFNISIPEATISEVFTVKELIIKLNEILFSGKSVKEDKKEKFSWKDFLKVEPPEEARQKINLSPNKANKFFSYIASRFLLLFFRIFFRFKISGQENIPHKGAYIICPNHASYLDGFVIGCSVPFKTLTNLYFLGDKNIFEHRLFKWCLKMARLIAIDSTKELMNTLQVSSYILHNNKMLCIFPEGLRSYEGKPTEFKKGVGILAKELEIPTEGNRSKEKVKIIPAAIMGTFQSWPRTRRFPRLHPIKVAFGNAVEVDELIQEGKAMGETDSYQCIATALEARVEELFYE